MNKIRWNITCIALQKPTIFTIKFLERYRLVIFPFVAV